MASVPSIKPRLPEDLKDDSRDVADLWKEALKNYKGIVGFDLERKFDNVQQMVDQGTKEMNKFHRFRHNEKKVDKLRSLFAENLDYLEIGAQQLIGAAVPAFPPAAAIGTALTYLLSACRQVSADYDIVVVFFEDMNSFLQRTVILETRMPKYQAYQNCLMDVFTSFLSMCGFAQKYVELGRFKKWITNLVEGQDGDLGAARQNMDRNLARLQNATEFAILGNTEELQLMSIELEKNQHCHTAMLLEQREVMSSIQDTAEIIRDDMAKLLKAFDDQKKDSRTKSSSADQSKPASAGRIRNSIPEVEDEDHEYNILKETMVEDTCTWVFSEPNWEEWLRDREGLRPLLVISGQQGTGKSHIGAAVYDYLAARVLEDSSSRTCAAHFYCREQHPSLSTFISAISTVINQVVEQSSPLCEMINNEFLKDENDIDIWSWEELTRSLIVPVFQRGSKNHLFLVIDAVDELEELSEFTEFLTIVQEEDLQISIICTTRPDILTVSEVTPILEIHVDKQKQLSDMKALIWNRLNCLNSLRRFGRYVQQRIAGKVEEAAPNLLYAEHMLLHFNSLGREGSVLRNLDKPLPADLNSLYETLFEECHRRTASLHQSLVTQLLHWLAYCYRPLVLDEVVSLLRYLSGDQNFDIEEIPEPFNKFLRVGDPGTDAEARAKIQAQGNVNTSVEELAKGQDTSSPDIIYNDGGLAVKFHERSMRSFFREAPQDVQGLRLKYSDAHRQMSLVLAKLARPAASPDDTSVNTGLREYATQYLISHWYEINPAEHKAVENAEVMEAFGMVLSNQTNYTRMVEELEPDYSHDFTEETFQKVAEWARLLHSEDTYIRSKLSSSVLNWWADLDDKPQGCLVELAKGHTRSLYSTSDLDKALTSYRAVRNVLQVGLMNDLLIDKARDNFPVSLGAVKEYRRLNEKEATLAMVGLFDDVEMGSTAYYSVASVMLHYKRRKAAETTCQKALELCKDTVHRVRVLELMARIQLGRENPDGAYQSIGDCVALLDSSEGITAQVKRWAYITKARVEVYREETEAAAASFAKARLQDPAILTPGDVLEEELDIFEQDQKTRYIETLKSFSPLERLTWMAWNYDDYGVDRHAVLRDNAVETGEKEFVVEMYEESIRYLDNVNAGAPLRVDLAQVYLQVFEDLEKSREILDQVLSSGSTGWCYAVTSEAPEYVLDEAINTQSDILSRLFRQSRDPIVKKQLLEETKNLGTRPLALDVRSQSQTNMMQRQIMLARMYLKLGPAEEFQNLLQEIIDGCVEALEDKVGWNDSTNLVLLASALTLLGKAIPDGEKLLRAAGILFSAKFSRLSADARVDDSDDEESGSQGEEDDDVDEDYDDGQSITSDEGESGDEDGDDGEWEDESEDGDEGEDGVESVDGGESENGVDIEAEGEADNGREAAGEDGNDNDNENDNDNNEEEGSGAGSDNESGSEYDPEEDEPTDEGDLDLRRHVEVGCNGKCNPATMFRWWAGRTGYECITCFGRFLCESCYQARQADNRGEESLKSRQYCGRNHEYLKGPIEGWQGIENGKLMLEGEEPLDFDIFLRQIKEELVKKAWESFWEG